MSNSENQTITGEKSAWLLFGLDLRTLWQDWLRAIASLHQYAPLSWFEITPKVRVLRPDGEINDISLTPTSIEPSPKQEHDQKEVSFYALMLPDDLVLSRKLTLPHLAEDQIREAVWLDIHSSSPFQTDDIAWGYIQKPQKKSGYLDVWLAFASKQQIRNYISNAKNKTWPVEQTEVWAEAADSQQQYPVVLQGYAEPIRLQFINKNRVKVWGGLVGSLLVLCAVLVAPTMQLRSQALQADAAYNSLVQQTQELGTQREAFAQTMQDLETVQTIAAKNNNALAILKTLTQDLPPDVYLNNLKLENNIIDINAFADDAAATLQKLGQSGAFEDVKFSRAVTRQQNLNKDSFNAQLTMKPSSFSMPMKTSPTSQDVDETPSE